MTIKPFTKIFVREGNFIYEVEGWTSGGDINIVNLQLYCGWDYIDPNKSQAVGWVDVSRFPTMQHSLQCTWVYMEESLKEALKSNGYSLLRGAPIVATM